MSTPPAPSSAAMHVRRTTWAITALQVGAVFFAGGLTLLYLNPFWHFDEHGLLDWRVHWWNGAAAVMIGGGLLIAALALVASAAVLVSRCVGRRLWPYAAAALLALCPVIWIGQSGYVRNLNAGFVWDAADGFSIFNLQSWDQVTGSWRPEGKPALQSLVAMQIEPLLRGYFKLNDWQSQHQGDQSHPSCPSSHIRGRGISPSGPRSDSAHEGRRSRRLERCAAITER
jgi:hypothetical protein